MVPQGGAEPHELLPPRKMLMGPVLWRSCISHHSYHASRAQWQQTPHPSSSPSFLTASYSLVWPEPKMSHLGLSTHQSLILNTWTRSEPLTHCRKKLHQPKPKAVLTLWVRAYVCIGSLRGTMLPHSKTVAVASLLQPRILSLGSWL